MKSVLFLFCVSIYCMRGVQSKNSEIKHFLVQNVLNLNSYHTVIDSFTFTPDQFEHLYENINITIKNFTILFYNLKISEVPSNYDNSYTTSLDILSGNTKLIVRLPCDFKIDADVDVWNPYISEQIIHYDSVSLNLRKIDFSKRLTIAPNGSIQENNEIPQITFNATKICIDLDSNSQFGTIIYEATENLIDNIKQQMRKVWMKQFEQQVNRSINYFPFSQSAFPNERDFQRIVNKRDGYNINEEIKSLKTLGIITRSITIEGLSNFAKMKMTVIKDANRLEDGSWSYHCARRAEAQIETNRLKGQLVWNYNDNSLTRNLITFHLNSFALKVNGGGTLEIDLGEIQIDPMNSYCPCSKELLHYIFAEQLKSVIRTSISDSLNTIYQNRIQQFENPGANIPQVEELDMNRLEEGSGY